jgi:hypothetical protein
MIVGGPLEVGLGGREFLRGGVEEGLDDFGNASIKEASVFVDQVGKAVWVEGGVDLLDHCALEQVAGFEGFHIEIVDTSGLGDDATLKLNLHLNEIHNQMLFLKEHIKGSGTWSVLSKLKIN